MVILRELKPSKIDLSDRWPDLHVPDPENRPVPFHIGQNYAFESERRIVAMIAGSQGGKTGFGPTKVWRWIQELGGGDYLAVTSTYDLFKMKMLPALRHLFVESLGIGRYWSGDRVLEIADPETGLFFAQRSDDPMYARIILRSADSAGGLEAGTAKGAWLDEAGQDKFDLPAWKSIKRRLAITQGPILITSTLYEVGWVDSEIIDVAQKGGSTTIERIEGRGELEITDNPEADVCLIQFDSTINPLYPMEEFEAARAELPDEEFEAFHRGRRVQSRLMVYDVFDKDRNKCPRFPIPQHWNRYVGIDPGDVNLAVVWLAERPEDKVLFVYRLYLAGITKPVKDHAVDVYTGEPPPEDSFCGAKSEKQWRTEFRAVGIKMKPPKVTDFDVGVSRVYACLKTGGLVVFDDLAPILDQFTKYRRKRDRQGHVLKEIENRPLFHYLDALRYVVASIRRPGRRPKAKVVRLG